MKRSTERILTTHAGSLPYFDDSAPENDDELRAAVRDVVALQRGLGIDLVNEGEFDAFYRYATERGTLFYTAGGQVSPRRLRWVCTGEISYAGQEQVRREIELLWAAGPGEDAFLTSTAPASLEVYRANAYYDDDIDYLYALAEALRVEYELILVPGVVTHSTDVDEHPDLVAQRIERFALVVGPENLIAGTECGFGGRTHPQIAWAKLRSLSEGAARASRSLGVAR